MIALRVLGWTMIGFAFYLSIYGGALRGGPVSEPGAIVYIQVVSLRNQISSLPHEMEVAAYDLEGSEKLKRVLENLKLSADRLYSSSQDLAKKAPVKTTTMLTFGLIGLFLLREAHWRSKSLK